jgi:hypothetical protein
MWKKVLGTAVFGSIGERRGRRTALSTVVLIMPMDQRRGQHHLRRSGARHFIADWKSFSRDAGLYSRASRELLYGTSCRKMERMVPWI